MERTAGLIDTGKQSNNPIRSILTLKKAHKSRQYNIPLITE